MIESHDEFIDEFQGRMLDAKLVGKVRVEFSPTDVERLISLDLIETDPEHRGQGLGDDALRLICELADNCGFAVQVIPKNINGPMRDEDLAAWYAKHGFRVSMMRRDPNHAGA
ncbi:MAG: GNAT family N-acetyltransferase [Steroidobacteraceae bacterium]